MPAKRSLDLVLAAALAIPAAATLCLLMAVSLAVQGRPVFYVAERMRDRDRTFRLFKLRTMETCPTGEQRVLGGDQRARVTPLGRWLRRTRLDEIPQLWNVLRGDMSLVGIRPVERAEFDTRSAVDQDCYIVLRPGLTGLWQIDGRSSLVPHERSELDRWYAANRSLALDLRILWRTPLAVLHVSRAH